MLQVFKDVAVIAQDVADVLSNFPTVPVALAKAGRDLTLAALHRDPIAVSAALDEVTALGETFKTDCAAAQPALDKLQADTKQLLADLQ